jgi:diacylglycerol kinase family enzyme
MRAVLVVNPTATTTSSQTRDAVARTLAAELDLELAPTHHRGHAAEIGAKAVRDGVDVVVVLGGDGTVNEVANGMLSHGPDERLPALGVVPGGSANVFARALGSSRNPEDATAALLAAVRAGRRRTIGLGRLNGRRFLFCAGMGIDAAVIRRVEESRARGHKATGAHYVRQAVAEFLRDTNRRATPIAVSLTTQPVGGPGGARPDAPAEEAAGRFAAVIVQNCAPWTFLGPRALNPNPEASFNAGLDLLALRTLGIPGTLRAVGQMLGPRPNPHGGGIVRRHDLAELTIRTSRPVPAQLDGEYLGEMTELRLESEPNALQVVGP